VIVVVVDVFVFLFSLERIIATIVYIILTDYMRTHNHDDDYTQSSASSSPYCAPPAQVDVTYGRGMDLLSPPGMACYPYVVRRRWCVCFCDCVCDHCCPTVSIRIHSPPVFKGWPFSSSVVSGHMARWSWRRYAVPSRS